MIARSLRSVLLLLVLLLVRDWQNTVRVRSVRCCDDERRSIDSFYYFLPRKKQSKTPQARETLTSFVIYSILIPFPPTRTRTRGSPLLSTCLLTSCVATSKPWAAPHPALFVCKCATPCRARCSDGGGGGGEGGDATARRCRWRLT